MADEHTPGPWDVQPPFSGMPSRWLVTSADGVVCDLGLNCGPQPANAQLIAAAPEMLAALKAIAADASAYQWHGVVRALIAKAEGVTHG